MVRIIVGVMLRERVGVGVRVKVSVGAQSGGCFAAVGMPVAVDLLVTVGVFAAAIVL